MLIEGKWAADWHPIQDADEEGRFQRQTSGFRNWITPDGTPGRSGHGGFPAMADRYHLYVALICPWASRTLMVRKLKKLENLITVSVVEPFLTEQGWAFGNYPGSDADPFLDAKYMHEIYTNADQNYSGRATVPVLWDKERETIVNNESADIIRMLNTAFSDHTETSIDLYPSALRNRIDILNETIYERLNNGVYKAGFASSQKAYDEAVTSVFDMLGELEFQILKKGPYLFGSAFTESDIRLFVTLVRFDAAYHGLFKCNIRRLRDYPELQAYTERIYNIPGIAETVNIDHIKAGYYSVKALNPSGIIPAGPRLPVGWQDGV